MIPEISREYPSPGFFLDRLRIELKRSADAGMSLEDVLDQLRRIWQVENRQAVLAYLENLARRSVSHRRHEGYSEDTHAQVAEALKDLVRRADWLQRGDRHKADLAVSKLVKYLDPQTGLEVLEPWMDTERPFRVNVILRILSNVEDLDPYADFLVRQFRRRPDTDRLRFIARSPRAAAQLFDEELDPFLKPYLTVFEDKVGPLDYKSRKYIAMIAAKVLVIGDRPIDRELMNRMPEVFSWAIEESDDTAHEPMLLWLIEDHADNPEVLWSALRTANRRLMTRALARAVEKAELLLASEPTEIVISTSRTLQPDLNF